MNHFEPAAALKASCKPITQKISKKTLRSLRPRVSSEAGVRNNQANGFICAITFGNCYKTTDDSLRVKSRHEHTR
jgi:hypothetical protein